jgi:hypothetical protein
VMDLNTPRQIKTTFDWFEEKYLFFIWWRYVKLRQESVLNALFNRYLVCLIVYDKDMSAPRTFFWRYSGKIPEMILVKIRQKIELFRLILQRNVPKLRAAKITSRARY